MLLTYSQGSWIVRALQNNRLPLGFAVVQPDSAVGDDWDELRLTVNQGVHGAQDNACAITRMGLKCQFFAGDRYGTEFKAWIKDFGKAAQTYSFLRKMKVGIIAKMSGMNDILADEMSVLKKIGPEYRYDNIGAVVQHMNETTKEEIDAVIERDRQIFDLDPKLTYESHYEAIKMYMDIHVRRGEIIGISGLMGAGRTEFALSVFGRSFGSKVTGTVLKAGKPIDTSTVSKAIDNGIAYVTEDRKGTGLVLPESIQDNIVLASLPKLANKGIRNKELELSSTLEQIKALNVKCSSHNQKVVNLSGGNQQKVVLAKWILSQPDVLILDEPTRGIDVGAKREIYCIMNDLVAQGKSVIFISSEMPELLGMCDRIYVVHDGKLVGELQKNEFSQENVMRCIMRNQ